MKTKSNNVPASRFLPSAHLLNQVLAASLLALLMLSVLPSTVKGAILNFSPAITISGDTDVTNNTGGTQVFAYTWGKAATVNGVAFAASSVASGSVGPNLFLSNLGKINAGAYIATAPPFNTLSGSYSNILRGAVHDTTEPDAAYAVLTNLTVGNSYFVQLWVSDPTGAGEDEAENISSGGTPVLLYFNFADQVGGVGQFISATFTADATSQSIEIDTTSVQPPLTGYPQINAIQLYSFQSTSSSTWTGGSTANGNWSNPQNWIGGVPGLTNGLLNSLTTAIFNSAIANTWGNAAANPVFIDPTNLNVGGIQFQYPASAYFIGAINGNPILLSSIDGGATGINSTATNMLETINSPIVMEPDSSTSGGTCSFSTTLNNTSASLNFGGAISGGTTTAGIILDLNGGTGAASNTVSGTISDGGAVGGVALARNGSGSANLWVLSGSNSYSGGTKINGGELIAANNNALGSGTVGVVVAQGGKLGLEGNISAGTQPLTLGGGLLNISGTNIYGGPIALNAVGKNAVSITSQGSGNLLLTNTATITDTTNFNFALAGAGNMTIDCGIGTNIPITYTGSGTVILTGTNFSTYPIIIGNPSTNSLIGSGGTLQFATLASLYNDTPINWTPANILVGSNSILVVNVGGSGEFAASDVNTLLTNIGATTSATNGLLANSSFGFDTTYATGPVAYSSPIADSTGPGGGPVTIIKFGAGTLSLSSANTYTGSTLIQGGTLALSNGGSIADSPQITISGGATFDVSGLSSTFTLGASQTLSNSKSTQSSAALNGNISTGSGTVSLAFANIYPAMSVDNGTLTLASGTIFAVNNSSGFPLTAGSYLLISAGTGGTVAGTLPAVTVTGGGIAVGATASLQVSGGELYLSVSGGTPPPQPNITKIEVLTGTTPATLALTATNGEPNGTYILLGSTNLTTPLVDWVPVLTNTFDGNGNLNLSTNIVNPNKPTEFYILSQ